MAKMKVQVALNKILKDLKEGSFRYSPKDDKEIEWASYSLAKINEIDFFLAFVRKAVARAERAMKLRRRGRPATDACDLAKIILVKEYFQAGERQASGLALLFREKLGIRNVPSPSTIDRSYGRRDVQRILGKTFEITNAPIKEKEGSFSADGTGLPLSIKQNYANDRNNHAKHAGYGKMAVMVSNNFHIASGFAHGNGTDADSLMLAPVIAQTASLFPCISDIELDAGFLSRDNCNSVSSSGAVPYIYPKRGIAFNKRGSLSWRKMLESLVTDPQAWMKMYHRRSNSECYFSAHKRRFTKPILRKIKGRRGVEAFARVIVLNICMLILAYFEHGVKVREFDNKYL